MEDDYGVETTDIGQGEMMQEEVVYYYEKQ